LGPCRLAFVSATSGPPGPALIEVLASIPAGFAAGAALCTIQCLPFFVAIWRPAAFSHATHGDPFESTAIDSPSTSVLAICSASPYAPPDSAAYQRTPFFVNATLPLSLESRASATSSVFFNGSGFVCTSVAITDP